MAGVRRTETALEELMASSSTSAQQSAKQTPVKQQAPQQPDARKAQQPSTGKNGTLPPRK